MNFSNKYFQMLGLMLFILGLLAGCAEVWPPFKSTDTWVIPSSLSQNDFATVMREDDLGPKLSYKRSPLYYFTPDKQIRGNVSRHGGAGGTFFVIE